jgi:hypothetical protein
MSFEHPEPVCEITSSVDLPRNGNCVESVANFSDENNASLLDNNNEDSMLAEIGANKDHKSTIWYEYGCV